MRVYFLCTTMYCFLMNNKIVVSLLKNCYTIKTNLYAEESTYVCALTFLEIFVAVGQKYLGMN